MRCHRCPTIGVLVLLAVCAVLFPAASAQQPDRQSILNALEKDGCVTLEKVKVCKYDYTADGKNLEALSFRPDGEGKFPGLLLVPGYQRRALDYLNLGRLLGGHGFASVAVTQPGFGKSEGPADYVGPKTIKALTAGFERFKHEPYVDADKMGMFGYSRGGMAVSLLAVKLKTLRPRSLAPAFMISKGPTMRSKSRASVKI